jgi:carbon monoxide dehydrogenase subunit G
MAESASGTITIAAGRTAVMDVIADFPAYPEWANGVKTAEVVDPGSGGRPRTVRFHLDAGVVKDDYVLAYDWAPDDSRVEWHLIEAKMQKDQRGSYTLVERGAETEVTYELSVDISIPMIGMFKRRAEKAIIDTALRDLKKRVEG